MKQFYSNKHLLCAGMLLLTMSTEIQAQMGTEEQPLSVTQGLSKTDGSSKTYWVTGYIVGEYDSYSNNKHFYEVAPPFNGTYAYLIADSKDEIDVNKCMTLQLPKSSFGEVDLSTHPEHWKKRVTVCGLLREYNTRPGVKSINNHYFEESTLTDTETILWNTYETFDDKGYVAASSSSVFAGGTYTGETGVWKIKGGTWGDTGNDNKWDKASIRLRFTEGSSGEKGSLELLSDKKNGLGEVRFWMGNYKEDASKSLAVALYYSTDQGKNWHEINNNIPVKRGNNVTTNGMSEYRFEVNKPGSVRVKFVKADNTTGGINIDNIRLSDYQTTTGISTVKEDQKIAYGSHNGIHILSAQAGPVEIYTISGQLIRRLSNVNRGHLISLPAGIYLIRNSKKTERIIVG